MDIIFASTEPELTSNHVFANFLIVLVSVYGVVTLARWIVPILYGKRGREPLCFRQTSKSLVPPMLTPAPIILSVFLISLMLFLKMKADFFPPSTPSPITVNGILASTLVFVMIGVFLLFLWELTSSDGRVSRYFCVSNWQEEVQAGAELMLFVMPWTILLGLISQLWKTSPEDLHPLLQLLQQNKKEALGATFLSAVIAAPLLEELLFRVLFLNGMIESGRMNRISAWLTVSIVFCLIHGFMDALQLLPLSLSLGWCLLRRQSYIAVVTAHALFNGFMTAVALLSM